jgi:predicted XRE-type DNA-binding protein
MTKRADTKVRRGSNNVFADLGFADADGHLLKAQLVSRIVDIIQKQKLTQSEAARLLGLSQPDVSRLLKGQFRDLSVERIMRLLMRLGYAVDIVIKQPGGKRCGPIIHLGQPESAAG